MYKIILLYYCILCGYYNHGQSNKDLNMILLMLYLVFVQSCKAIVYISRLFLEHIILIDYGLVHSSEI